MSCTLSLVQCVLCFSAAVRLHRSHAPTRPCAPPLPAAAKFDFNDFLKQYKMVTGMGNLSTLVKMLPGGWLCSHVFPSLWRALVPAYFASKKACATASGRQPTPLLVAQLCAPCIAAPFTGLPRAVPQAHCPAARPRTGMNKLARTVLFSLFLRFLRRHPTQA